MLNPDFSDEFNGTQLDSTKWLDHHPTWKGRVPGLFLPSQVSVKDGCLQIEGKKLEKDIVIDKGNGKKDVFTIAGGAVVSKQAAYRGYYECRLKAAKTTMSTTFWFSGGGGEGPHGCDSYGLEWDIQECIGRNGDFDGSYFANGMHSNSHYWYTDCDGEKFDHRAEQVKFEDPELASEDFHVYGGWWRDETKASYYYDNGEPKHQIFYNEISEKPFDRPLYMRLVSETYPFPWIELPSDEELADPTKNIAYYDWVRGYKLVDVEDPNHIDMDTKRGTQEGGVRGTVSEDKAPVKPRSVVKVFDEKITFNTDDCELSASGTLKIAFTYKANEEREDVLELHDSNGGIVADATIAAYAGYANRVFDFAIGKDVASKSGLKLTGSIRPINSDRSDHLSTDSLDVDRASPSDPRPQK
ncbi:beta-porphyranase D [Novipirellula herctigrandis]|uniref:beta-porphyranase D n=1 Tax=Novipirellula herctigrandis TaxID=2527986 RepID=UPI003AF3AC11